jgi:hypothetical protein
MLGHPPRGHAGERPAARPAGRPQPVGVAASGAGLAAGARWLGRGGWGAVAGGWRLGLAAGARWLGRGGWGWQHRARSAARFASPRSPPAGHDPLAALRRAPDSSHRTSAPAAAGRRSLGHRVCTISEQGGACRTRRPGHDHRLHQKSGARSLLVRAARPTAVPAAAVRCLGHPRCYTNSRDSTQVGASERRPPPLGNSPTRGAGR